MHPAGGWKAQCSKDWSPRDLLYLPRPIHLRAHLGLGAMAKVALADQCWLGLRAAHGQGGSEWGLWLVANLTLDSVA